MIASLRGSPLQLHADNSYGGRAEDENEKKTRLANVFTRAFALRERERERCLQLNILTHRNNYHKTKGTIF